MTGETTMLTAKLICCHTRTYKTMATLFCLGVNNVATRWTQSAEPLNLSRVLSLARGKYHSGINALFDIENGSHPERDVSAQS